MSLDFDGVDDIVDFGDPAGVDGATALSILWWENEDTLVTGESHWIKLAVGTNHTFRLRNDNTTSSIMVFETTVDNYGSSASGAIIAGRWTHWAYVYNGGGAANADRLKMYKDGVEQSLTFTGTIPASLFDAGANTIRFGGHASADGFVDMKAGHVKLFTTNLSAAEVGQEVMRYRPVRRTNLIIWSPCDDGVRARDYSGNSNHGTVTGALTTGGPPQIPHPERFIAQKHRHGGLGLWGHRVLVK